MLGVYQLNLHEHIDKYIMIFLSLKSYEKSKT